MLKYDKYKGLRSDSTGNSSPPRRTQRLDSSERLMNFRRKHNLSIEITYDKQEKTEHLPQKVLIS